MKSIDINQRIPLDTLHTALTSLFNEDYDNDYIVQQLRLDFTGENRLKKALRIVNKTILQNPQKEFLLSHKEELQNVIKRKTDRNIILIALLNSAFPFSFDVLSAFAKYFAVQEYVNTETFKRDVTNVYGGNRASENGIYSVVPMFLEAELFTRPKQGIYQWTQGVPISSALTKAIYQESFRLNQPFDKLQDYQLLSPYFDLIEL
jgi:hypothetical protein